MVDISFLNYTDKCCCSTGMGRGCWSAKGQEIEVRVKDGPLPRQSHVIRPGEEWTYKTKSDHYTYEIKSRTIKGFEIFTDELTKKMGGILKKAGFELGVYVVESNHKLGFNASYVWPPPDPKNL